LGRFLEADLATAGCNAQARQSVRLNRQIVHGRQVDFRC
jgi:hypothetical protein